MSLGITSFVTKALANIRRMSNRYSHSDTYVWIDLEMTGLDPEKDKILEVACLLTTPHLDLKHEGINLIIHQPDDVLSSMNEWCLLHHAKSGLTEASRQSKISVSDADQQVYDYICRHCDPKSLKYLAGNSVHMDRMFLLKHMPKVIDLLHYRLIDISSIKVLCKHWYPDQFSKVQKKLTHRALDDIKESINELRIYRNLIFK